MLRSMMRMGVAAVVLLGATGIAAAAPASAGCETNMLGAQYCDSPVRADGTWDRCWQTNPTPYFGQYGQVAGILPGQGKCYPVGVDQQWLIGEPQYHIYP